jgi:hypothetical protein
MKLHCRKTITTWSLLALVITAPTQLARAADDNENSTPTSWWVYAGQPWPRSLSRMRLR